MAAKPQLSNLPAELRAEIWSLALLPSPGVYRCDPHKFIYARGNRSQVEDARWLIPKRRWPTVAHLCRESRLFALGVMEKESEEKSSVCCIGQDARPFMPEIDTFWFDDGDDGTTLHHHAVIHERGVVGGRVHVIRNLAVSAALVQSCRRHGVISNWDSYLFQGIGRFENLRHVDVVFGPVPTDTRCDGYETDKDCWTAAARDQLLEEYDGQVVLTGVYDVPELWLEEISGPDSEITGLWADKNQGQNPGVVKEKLDKVRDDVYRGFRMRASYLAKYPPRRPQGQEDATRAASGQEQGQQQQQGAAEFAHREKDLSEITFHAARMIESTRFRGRTIRKSFPSWYFSEDYYSDDLGPPSRPLSVKKGGSRVAPAFG
ncbi:hypothetical protein PpBr36_08600 [Pyricularia pennisetigena]|uniref:hypothetical protein n=1 Tax=Pyricularia pennisetigena TaxID=1578925 RepID=UPI0011543CB8|nr:hypothetical protein PpBr36_08600 [Pyricularia pennisetigena]TLS24868.1 hypothetical protein PpBr36_08600 [Pyricularia pennisetigena]